MPKTLTIDQPEDLGSLLDIRDQLDSVQVRLKGMAEDQRAELSQNLTRLATECGCGASGVAALAIMAIGAPIAFFLWRTGLVSAVVAALPVAMALVLAPIATKLVITVRARRALRAEVARLRLSLEKKNEKNVSSGDGSETVMR